MVNEGQSEQKAGPSGGEQLDVILEQSHAQVEGGADSKKTRRMPDQTFYENYKLVLTSVVAALEPLVPKEEISALQAAQSDDAYCHAVFDLIAKYAPQVIEVSRTNVTYIPKKGDDGKFFLGIKAGSDVFIYQDGKACDKSGQEVALPANIDRGELAAQYAPLAELNRYLEFGGELEVIVGRIKKSAAQTVGSMRRELRDVIAERKKIADESVLLAQQRGAMMAKASRGADVVIATTKAYQERLDALEPAIQKMDLYSSLLAAIGASTAGLKERVKTAEENVSGVLSAAENLKEHRMGLEARLMQVTENVARSETTVADIASQEKLLADKFAETSNNLEALEIELHGFVARKDALEKMYAHAEEAEALLSKLDEFKGNVEKRQAEVDALRETYSNTVDELMGNARELSNKFDVLGVTIKQNRGDATQQIAELQKVKELLEQARPAYEAAASLWDEVAEAKAELAEARKAAGVAPVSKTARVTL